MTKYILGGISLPPDSGRDEALAAAAKCLRTSGIAARDLAVFRRSVDARKKEDVRLVYAVLFTSENEIKPQIEKRLQLRRAAAEELTLSHGTAPLCERPLIVGFGPCGMFCALLLSREGYRPIVIERGADVDTRVRDVDAFYGGGDLDENSNIQFGAGGAGTFSDGKLVTRIGDSRSAFVLSTFARLGAPREILTNAKPHIGTDILRTVVKNVAAEILALGGEIHYGTRFLGYAEMQNGSRRIKTTAGDFFTSALVLAIGHSARDTYAELLLRGVHITAKDFSVGLRVEHKKADIDRALYGRFAGTKNLPYAEYNLSWNTKVRGVYTFCMCPGGEVVCGASERGGLCVNGMSRFARDGENSNSAVCVSVFRGDFGGTPERAIDFVRTLEQKAFAAGGGTYAAPVSTLGDFLAGRDCKAIGDVCPTYMNGRVRPTDLRALFPAPLAETLCGGLRAFGKKIPGFDRADALLSGVETRTSAPVRILRTQALTMEGTDDIYPGGEGAGYAGGITSAAVDGLRIAEAIMAKFRPFS
ncbi:MAG: hypothetical protein IJS44_06150 [Clostridia bacterium]|nr:hypothetical protein [Clostridia bacterium]